MPTILIFLLLLIIFLRILKRDKTIWVESPFHHIKYLTETNRWTPFSNMTDNDLDNYEADVKRFGWV